MHLSVRHLGTAAALAALATLGGTMDANAQPAHIFGIHDDTFPSVNNYLALLPGGTGWITATEALGSNPADMGGKNYNPPSGTKIIARLNFGYFPNGTLPVQSQYANFAQRVANFVNASTGCDTWVIGNETNLASEWPSNGPNSLETITPAAYAQCFKLCYNAIKAVRPNDKVVVQALAPWAGPYGGGTLGPYSHAGMPDNWVDHFHKVLTEITSGPDAVIPDGIAMHINTRGYAQSSFNPVRINAGGLPLDFSWGVHRDWIQFGVPRALWNLPLYATECNGLYYWKGGGPEGPGDPAYQAGWMQRLHAEVNDWNQIAGATAMPAYRAVNMYRWPNADNWGLQAEQEGNTAIWQQLSADLAAAAANNYQWPPFGGNALNLATPPGVKAPIAGFSASSDASGDAIVGFEPDKAFDGVASTKWSSRDLGNTAIHWLVADLGANPPPINGYIIRHASNTGLDNANRNTVGFMIEVSNDSATGPWTLHTMVRNNTPGTNGAQVTELTYDTPITARYVRLYINASANLTSGVRGRISEFEIYTDPPASVGDLWRVE